MANKKDNVTVRFWNSEYQALNWKADPHKIEKVQATVGAVCGENALCAQTFETPAANPNRQISFKLTVPPQEVVRINLDLYYGDSKTPVAQPAIMMQMGCDDGDVITDVIVPDPPAPEENEVPAILTIQGHYCMHKPEYREQRIPVPIEEVEIETVSFLKGKKPKAPDKNTPAVEKTIEDGIAIVTLPVGGVYEINVQTRGKYIQTCPSVPFRIPVTKSGGMNVQICFEKAERFVALLFVNESGKPTTVPDVCRVGDGRPLTIDAGGYCRVSAETPIKLISSGYTFTPDIIAAHQEAQIVRAVPKTDAVTQKSAAGLCVFQIPNLGKLKAYIRVTKEDGHFVTNLTPDANGAVTYKPDDPNEALKYICFVDGKEHDTILTKAV